MNPRFFLHPSPYKKAGIATPDFKKADVLDEKSAFPD
jgi:hypothetical protein